MLAIVTAATALLASSWTNVSAQYGGRPEVPARFDYSGSAVCPNGYDFRRGRCVARGYDRGDDRGYGSGEQYGGYRERYRAPRDRYGYDQGNGGDEVAPRWNRSGSAVCPTGYDYAARRNSCVPQ